MTQPTHNRGNFFNLVISKGLNISKVQVSDVDDHHCVFSEIDISVHKCLHWTLQRSNSKHYITENISNIFSQAFSSTPPLSMFSVNGLVDLFRSQIKFVIDAMAPTKVKVSVKKKSPWRNATLVKMEWNKCWKTNLQVHFDIYKERLYIFSVELRSSRQSFFLDIPAFEIFLLLSWYFPPQKTWQTC